MYSYDKNRANHYFTSRVVAPLIGIILCFVSSFCAAAGSPLVVITGNNNINTPTVYTNETLDLSNGRFTINTGGSITIDNSIVDVTISPSNPFFIRLVNGEIHLRNSKVNVHVEGITPNPDLQSLYRLLNVEAGLVSASGNTFTIDTPFTVTLLGTHDTMVTHGMNISKNVIRNFHGGLYLIKSDNAEITENTFDKVSFANIFVIGNMDNIINNTLSFPGNSHPGDGIDLINANNIIVSGNIIEGSANTGVYMMGGQHVFVENNKITDGLCYGIFIQMPSLATIKKNKYLSQLLGKTRLLLDVNTDISVINNYMAQNRYGLAAEHVTTLAVRENYFFQKFTNNAARQFWTNNSNLLIAVSNLHWENNLYKEAFSQEVPGDNSLTHGFVPFPEQGGVSLP